MRKNCWNEEEKQTRDGEIEKASFRNMEGNWGLKKRRQLMSETFPMVRIAEGLFKSKIRYKQF